VPQNVSNFKAKMHQIRFPLDSNLDPAGELTVLARHLAVFNGPPSKERGRREVKGR